MSEGTGIQLAATAPIDTYLVSSDGTSFFTPGYFQYGQWNSTVEEVDFPLGLDFGQTSIVTIPHKGDLLGESYLLVTLPALGMPGTWVDAVGYALLREVSLQLDASVLHSHTVQATDALNKLLLPIEKLEALNGLVCRGEKLSLMQEHTLHIPFDWFFTNVSTRIQTRLPLSGMSSSVLQLHLTIAPLANLVLLQDTGVKVLPNVSLSQPLLLFKYYHITRQERAAQSRCTTLIRQVQETEATNYTIDSSDMSQNVVGQMSVPLPFTRDTTLLSWVVQDESHSTLGRDFAYTDAISNVALTFNSSTRFETRTSNYYSHVQALHFARDISCEPIGLFSFAVDASNIQPSGSCHMGLIPNPTLRIGFNPPAAVKPVMVRVFGMTLNELVIQDRRGVLKYA